MIPKRCVASRLATPSELRSKTASTYTDSATNQITHARRLPMAWIC